MRASTRMASLAGLAFGCVWVLSGCKTAQPGAKNYAGTVTGPVAAEPARVTAAARETVEELTLNSIFSEVSTIDGMVTARTARDKQVDIDIKQDGENVSRVCIRVGDWGDETLSLQIL